MVIRLIFLVTVLSGFISELNGQSNPTSTNVDLVERTPASPNAGSLGKYFDFPVSMATGTPTITIPLYTIQTGKITVPISLSYNASGVKVGERASWVGTNWSLNAGASINKRTNGYDDVYATATAPSGTSGPQYNYINPNYNLFISGFDNISDIVDSLQSSSYVYSHAEDMHKFFGRIAQGSVDGEADEYFYSTKEGSGTFFYNQKDEEFQNNKLDGYKIQYSQDSTFNIITKSGLAYEFGLKEHVVNPIWKSGRATFMKYVINTWHLTGISDFANGRGVGYTYENRYSDEMIGRSMFKDYEFISSTPVYFGGDITDILREGEEYTVTGAYFNEGKVLFVKDTASRLDGGTKALREVQVYNNRNKLVKKVKLDYSYLTCDTSFIYCSQVTYRLFLSSIRETEYNENGDSLVKEPYVFTYKNNTILPCVFSIAQDHWGFYNGKKSNTTLIPTNAGLTSLGIPSQGNREIDTAYTQSGILQTIKYPTGGTTKFEFENNRTEELVGGLRVKKITHTDSIASKTIVTEYEYKDASGQSSGQVLYNPVYYYEYQYLSGNANYPVYRLEGEAIYPLFPNQGSPVLYTEVLEKKIGSEGELRTRHYFTGFWSEGTVAYQNMCCGVPHNKYVTRADLFGQEYKTSIYKKESTGTYSLIQTDSLSLVPLSNNGKYVWNAQASWTTVMDGWIVWPGNDPYSTNPINLNASVNAYKLYQQSLVKDSAFSTQYSGTNSITTGSFLKYDQLNGSVKEMKTVDSNGDTTITQIKYSGDYEYTGTYPGVNYEIKTLQDYNMKSEPVETIILLKKKDSTTSTVVSASLYEYENLRVKKVYKVYENIPYSSFTVSYNNSGGFYKDSHYKIVQEITAWDATTAKPLTVIANTNKTSYTWDSLYSQPTSVTANASNEDIAFTSFEGYHNGQWTVGSTNRDSTYSITGKKSYLLSSGSVSKSGLTSSGTYIVSYWSRNGSYTVSGSTGTVQGKTIDGWTYYEHTLTGVTTLTLSGSGTSYIDELRLYPKGAQMTSFCYEELIGMTAQSDPSGHIVYYEYFGPGYLKIIKDEDKKIIKRMDYKYQVTHQQ